MPRYFFHLLDGRSLPDKEGTELPDVASAIREARRTVGEIIRDGSFGSEEWRLQVVDERGAVIRTLYFSSDHRRDR